MQPKSVIYPSPPYLYEEYRKLSAFCEGNEKEIKRIIPSPFEYISNIFEVSIINITKISGLRPYMEAAMAVPVKYKDIIGGHVVYEWTSTDDALCAGREIWGYPKKLLDRAELIETQSKIYGNVWRKGVKILSINCKIRKKTTNFKPPILQPRLQLKIIPRANGIGDDIKKIIRIPVKGWLPYEATSLKTGETTVSFEESEADPLYKLMPLRVLNGVYAIGSFTLGYGEEIADLNSPSHSEL
jgi:acetoacetate decarboxylase